MMQLQLHGATLPTHCTLLHSDAQTTFNTLQYTCIRCGLALATSKTVSYFMMIGMIDRWRHEGCSINLLRM